jgi:hypothetical protein
MLPSRLSSASYFRLKNKMGQIAEIDTLSPAVLRPIRHHERNRLMAAAAIAPEIVSDRAEPRARTLPPRRSLFSRSAASKPPRRRATWPTPSSAPRRPRA